MELDFNTSDVIEFSKLYLAVFYSMVAIFYTSRVIIKKRQHGRTLIFKGERYCKTWWNHVSFRFFRTSIWLVCLFRLFFPNIDNYLGMIDALTLPLLITLGLFLLTAGFVSTALIHFSLREEWRSGIDPLGPSRLIIKGPYQYSRNPMFFSVAIAQLGFFFSIPSIFTFICLIIGLYTLNSQALEEEEHLSRRFPIEYGHYRVKVRRWL